MRKFYNKIENHKLSLMRKFKYINKVLVIVNRKVFVEQNMRGKKVCKCQTQIYMK